jgi:hypothetical protein
MHLGWGAGLIRETLARLGVGQPLAGTDQREYASEQP